MLIDAVSPHFSDAFHCGRENYFYPIDDRQVHLRPSARIQRQNPVLINILLSHSDVLPTGHEAFAGLGIGIVIREVDYVEIISMSQSRGFHSLYK